MDKQLLKDKAILYIGISKKTSFEVVKKLKGLKAAPLVIDQIISELEELGYIDDNEYVKAYIRQNIKLKKYSIYEITQKLLQKGVNPSIIDGEIEKLKDSNYESEVIENLFRSKLKSFDKLKQRAYLFRRGFKSQNSFDD